MTLLNRSLAPINDEIWSLLNEEARDYLSLKLTGRKLVDIAGPKGSEFAAVNTGDVKQIESPEANTELMSRTVIPLVELKVPFTLQLNELEKAVRGAEDIDLDPLLAAADKVIQLEDGAIYNGLDTANLAGIKQEAEFQLDLSSNPDDYLSVIVSGINKLQDAGVNAPYSLVLNEDLFTAVMSSPDKGYPLYKRLNDLQVKQILSSPVIKQGGLLLSARGGDFKFTLGTDLSIGFNKQQGQKLEFFFTESFATRVIAPEAAVGLK